VSRQRRASPIVAVRHGPASTATLASMLPAPAKPADAIGGAHREVHVRVALGMGRRTDAREQHARLPPEYLRGIAPDMISRTVVTRSPPCSFCANQSVKAPPRRRLKPTRCSLRSGSALNTSSCLLPPTRSRHDSVSRRMLSSSRRADPDPASMSWVRTNVLSDPRPSRRGKTRR